MKRADSGLIIENLMTVLI